MRPSAVLPLAAAAVAAPAPDAQWSTWCGEYSCRPSQIHRPRNEEQVSRIVRDATARGTKVKVVGAGHSYSATAVCTDGGEVISLSDMNRSVSVDKPNMLATVEAGMRLNELYPLLESYGFGLLSLGTIRTQSVAGAITTGTHGTYLHGGSLASHVVALRIVLANGTVAVADESRQDFLNAARVTAGALGVITQVTLRCVRSYRLKSGPDAVAGPLLMENFAHKHMEYVQRQPRLSWSWYAHTASTWIPTYGGPENLTLSWFEPCTDGGDPKCKLWWEAQADKLDFQMKTYEREYSVDVHDLPLVVDAFRAFVAAHSDDVDQRALWAVGGRYIEGEDAWLAPAHKRTSVMLTFFMYCSDATKWTKDKWPPPPEAEVPCLTDWIQKTHAVFGEGLEQAAYAHGGRPHWGKENNANASYLATRYPSFGAFTRLAKELDPTGTFVNAYLVQRMRL